MTFKRPDPADGRVVCYGTAGVLARACRVCGGLIEPSARLWCIVPKPNDPPSLGRYARDVGDCCAGRLPEICLELSKSP